MGAREDILEAFCARVVTRPAEAVSVAELCSAANVSKKTYYNHFQSRQDMLAAVLERDFFDPMRQLRASLFPNQLDSSVAMLLQLTYETFLQKKSLYLALIKNVGEAAFFDTFSRLSCALNREIYAPLQALAPEEVVELDYLCMFLATTSASSLRWWMARGFHPSPQEVASLYHRYCFARIDSQETPFPEMCRSTARC